MNNDLKKILNSDTDGLLTYEYIANHMGSCDEDMPVLADNIIRVDMTGQDYGECRIIFARYGS